MITGGPAWDESDLRLRDVSELCIEGTFGAADTIVHYANDVAPALEAAKVAYAFGISVPGHHGDYGYPWRPERCLRKVGLPNGPQVARSYPHQLSGGMAQRVAIGMAIARNPRLEDWPVEETDPMKKLAIEL